MQCRSTFRRRSGTLILDRTVGSRCGDPSKAFARSCSVQRWGVGNLAPVSLTTGSPKTMWTPHLLVRAQAHTFLVRTSQCTIHSLIRILPMVSHRHWLKVSGNSVVHFSKTTSQVRPEDAYHGGLMEEQRETRRIKKKKKIQKTPTILRLRLGTTKENLLPKNSEVWVQLLAHGARFFS